ncbi:MAG: DNA mismatch repair protein MutS [Candidatus Eremiobacteraeota bacterium]|nr:DNA mismatch repair protein MutS [Candidatus Eremiobacteraeota bacterium]
MLEQYFGMKAKHPEAILLSRVGDFYEAYGEDAEIVAKALQIALTSKEAGGGRRVAMAGVPHHALGQYLARLVHQRFIVALAEQLEVPQPNRLVRRDIVRLVTPGTLVEDQLLEGGRNNYLAAVTVAGESFALAYADVSTGYSEATAVSGEGAYEEILAELSRIEPTEIVADLPASLRAAIAGSLESSGARVTTSSLRIVDDRQRPSLGGFSLDESLAIARALDALGDFVKRTGVSNGERATASPHLYRRRQYLAIDSATRKHLELTSAQGRNPRATLLATLDRCVTTMGSRLLGRWIVAPLIDTAEIAQRADAIEALGAQHARRDAIREILKGTFDLERIAQKIRYRRTTPRDLASLRRTLELLPALRELSLPAVARFFDRIGEFDVLLRDLQATLAEDPPAQIGDGGALRPQPGSELAECVALRTDARTRLSELEERERERTGIKGLKIKYAAPFGYAIEVAKSHAAAVPEHYVRKQTLVNGERYITAELKELELAISSAQARQERLEAELFAALVERAAGEVERLHDAADAVAHIDVLAALAQCAAERAYVRPTFVDESSIAIEDGRHPVMEAIAATGFVPNDLSLRVSQHRFILLTGPNMGGKSTFLRQAGLLTIMAQIGSFVPAKRMELGVVDRVFTRIGAGDDLASGQSTFYMEMAEAANILRRSTARSLLLIDEVGRGTGTLDGLAIAQAICEFLLSLEEQAPLVLFATHFHELCSLAEHWKLVANYHITAVENTARGGAPVFSHRVQPGSSSRSFGIEVARMAGIPEAVIERAQEIADALSGEADVEARVPLKKKMPKRPPPERQLSFLR